MRSSLRMRSTPWSQPRRSPPRSLCASPPPPPTARITRPPHYGSPLDGPDANPPINCDMDEGGLVLAGFGKCTRPPCPPVKEKQLMWCAPKCNTTAACPADRPSSFTTPGTKPSCLTNEGNCVITCTNGSDCGAGAICGDIRGALNSTVTIRLCVHGGSSRRLGEMQTVEKESLSMGILSSLSCSYFTQTVKSSHPCDTRSD